MDGRHFDDLTRKTATSSRRDALRLLGGTATGGLLGLLGIRREPARAQSSVECCPADHPALCGLTCTNLETSADHCGTCGNACKGNETCRDGECVKPVKCKRGKVDCGGVCVDLRTDPANCGACGVPCAGTCENGTCVGGGECTPGASQACGSDVGVCVPGTQTCQSNGTWGECEGEIGPQPETCNGMDDDCDGIADNVDSALLKTDPANCGACGNECGSGQNCVDGECITPDCESDDDCPASGPCMGGVCTDGTCGEAPLDNGTVCDDGNPCTQDSVCTSGTCGGGVAVTCDDDNPCTTDSCDPSTGCVHENVPDETICGENGVCLNGACVENPECTTNDDCGACGVCNGGTCAPATAGMVCRQAAGTCEFDATCDGASMTCPENAYRPATHVCRAELNDCDIAETCTGSSAECPTDVRQADGTECGSAGTCQGGVCVEPGECEPGDIRECGVSNVGLCQYGTQTCQSDRTWGECEGAVNPITEVCNGLDDDCDGTIDNVDPLILLSDPQNCGKCGNACADGETCSSGACIAA